MTLSSTSNGQNADEEDNDTELDNDNDDEKLHTDTSVMHLGFQDPLEREMKLYAALPLLRCVFVPSNVSNLLVRLVALLQQWIPSNGTQTELALTLQTSLRWQTSSHMFTSITHPWSKGLTVFPHLLHRVD